MKKDIQKIIEKSILNLQKEKKFSAFKIPEIKINYPDNKKFGDYSSNIAMILAGKLKKRPMDVAEEIKDGILRFAQNDNDDIFEKVEAAKPGYVNFYLSEKYLQNLVGVINEQEKKYGDNKNGGNKKVLIEFISSNPTGPIHLGNGRGGPLGDTLANVLEKSGYQAEKEFFINNFGGQVKILGHSVLKDKDAQYKGSYIDDLAKKLKSEKSVKNKTSAKETGLWAADIIMEEIIKPTCEKMGIKFNNWFSEKDLHNSGETDEIVKILEKEKLVFKKNGATWYKSTKFNDDKDRVLIKSDGSKTYIAVDLAYHKNKMARGFDKLINIQGADHHKEAEVVSNFIEEILGEKNKLNYILNQFVRIIKDGQEVKMSKRKGVYFAMDDLIEEVGIDAVRFIFLSYTPHTHINFDINLAKEQSEKNPVYYVQYAHARIQSILVKAKSVESESRKKPPLSSGHLPLACLPARQGKEERIGVANLKLLTHEKELDLIKELNKFPELIEEISKSYEVHKLPHYAIRLADKFHSFYAECQVINENNSELSLARQGLVNAVRITLAETLRLMGVSAPKCM